MKSFFFALLLYFSYGINAAYSQKFVDKVKFFNNTSVLNATLTFNIGKLINNKATEGIKVPAIFSCKQGDSLEVKDPMLLELRGHSGANIVICRRLNLFSRITRPPRFTN